MKINRNYVYGVADVLADDLSGTELLEAILERFPLIHRKKINNWIKQGGFYITQQRKAV